MTEVATEAMEETDLNVDLTVVENILVETIEIEVTQMKSNMNSKSMKDNPLPFDYCTK